jgi:XTP/dITP diphosphohydrolase
MRLLLATTNLGKAEELAAGLRDLPLELRTLRDLPQIKAPAEEAETLKENAEAKSTYYHTVSGLPVLADDSGIFVEALGDELGVHTRRWGAGADATDQEWIAYFLKRMEKEPHRRARFICVLAFTDESGTSYFEGVCDGTITETVEAPYPKGLPLTGCFRPDGYDLVFAALGTTGKGAVSHRGRALKRFRSYLSARLDGLKPIES